MARHPLRLAIATFALLITCEPVAAKDAVDVARDYNLSGELLVSRGDRISTHVALGIVKPGGPRPHRIGERWRLASITKQVTAAMLVREHWRELDKPLKQLPSLTLRQLLTHHSGLPNPDATPIVDGVPSFYREAAPDLDYCSSTPAKPGSAFSYNNCDYLVAATLLKSHPRWPKGMTMAAPSEVGVQGFIANRPEPKFAVSSFGAAGGLVGTVKSVFRFDRALMKGEWLSDEARTALWTPEGNGSAQALGQWVFEAPLKGCASPMRIVQRDGEIFGMQARNFILPDLDMTIIVFTNRSSDDFAMGEVWEGRGFVYDLLSAAACGADVG